MKTRRPVVAGKFYPANKKELDKLIENIYNEEKTNIQLELAKHELIGAIVPHAGYQFSAYQAVHVFALLQNSPQHVDTFVILNPDHYGYGPGLSIDDNEAWETPFGTTSLDLDMAGALPLEKSTRAQQQEHSGEVMLPLLQKFVAYDFKILPVAMTQQSPANASFLAKEIEHAARQLNKKVFVLASSDFSHFVTPEMGQKNDNKVIEKILALDTQGVFNTIINDNISVCGYGPIMALMEYSQRATTKPKINVLRRGHSGDTMPSAEVVHYMSMLFSK
jgi:hypothetical protein